MSTGFVDWLMGGKVSEPIEAVDKLIDNAFTSDEERLTAEQLKEKIRQRPMLAQAEINKVQASHRSIFVAGARPALMWICVVGFFMAFVVDPIMQYMGVGKIDVRTDEMMSLTIAMLGIGGYRMIEKIKGVTK